MATIDSIPEGTAQTLIDQLGIDVLRYFLDIKSAIDTTDEEIGDYVPLIDDPTVDNIVTVTATGSIQDSGKDLPAGELADLTSAQTFTNKTLTTPTITGGTQTSPTITTPTIADLTNMTHDHTDAAGGGDYAWADMALAATQTDAAASEVHAITDPADTPATADALRDDLVLNTIPSIEAALNALGAEFNTKFNDLIDKLQTAKHMT